MAYKVAIIGAGRIGALLDNPQSPNILNHAHGYNATEGFEIVAFVDRELSKAEAASKCWGGNVFDSIDGLFAKQAIDVVSVCVPDEVHYETLVSLAKRPVKFVFLEKPSVRTPAEAKTIGALYRELPMRVLVNYTRRFVPEIRKIKEAIEDGDFGVFIAETGYYGKGLLHNGSHMVDLLQFLLGDVGEVEKISETSDCYDDDPSVSALLTMRGGGSFFLRHIDSRKFDVFELDLTFELKRVRICELGSVIEEYSVGENDVFKGYRTLNKCAEYSTDHRRAISHAVANIRGNLDHNEPLACTLEESFRAVRTCSRILLGHAG